MNIRETMHNPIPYRPAFERPRMRLPGGARLAIHLIVNVERWDLNARLPRTLLSAPAGGEPIPDVPNFAWYEYGNRVGIWRFLDVLEKFGAGWEMMGHGFVQKTMAAVPDEAEVIAKTLETLERKTGVRPRGWLGPG